uniref:Basic tail secreted protein n=1 Tax=Rhipicephalus appendiculatus TaxID=34631 RepID=A0A131YGL9_RHIAP
MAHIKTLFVCLFIVVALPKLKAWTQGDIYCHRLVPLQITSVVTPCVYPCVLISPHIGHAQIILRHEANGTPCKITRNQPLALQESRCMNGFCQLSDLGLQLTRRKTQTKLIRKRRGLIEKAKRKLKKRKQKKKEKKLQKRQQQQKKEKE